MITSSCQSITNFLSNHGSTLHIVLAHVPKDMNCTGDIFDKDVDSYELKAWHRKYFVVLQQQQGGLCRGVPCSPVPSRKYSFVPMFPRKFFKCPLAKFIPIKIS